MRCGGEAQGRALTRSGPRSPRERLRQLHDVALRIGTVAAPEALEIPAGQSLDRPGRPGWPRQAGDRQCPEHRMRDGMCRVSPSCRRPCHRRRPARSTAILSPGRSGREHCPARACKESPENLTLHNVHYRLNSGGLTWANMAQKFQCRACNHSSASRPASAAVSGEPGCHNPDMGYGVETVETVARQINRDLAGR